MNGFKFDWQRAFLDSDLPSGVKLVLLVISTYMSLDGTGAYPTRARIARDASLSDFRSGLHIQAAVDAGWITRRERRSTGPLSGKAAQGWRHYQYAAAIPTTEGGHESCSPSTEAEQEKLERVDTNRAHLTPEGGHESCYRVDTNRATNNQVNNQEKTNRESARARAPVAAGAAPPPAIVPDQSKGQTQAAKPKPRCSGKQAGGKAGKGTRFGLEEIPRAWGLWASEFCETNALDLDIHAQFAKFADYWRAKPGKDASKSDWLATWRNWWRRELDYAQSDPRRAAAIEDQRNADAARRRQEDERRAAAEKAQADQVEQAARKAAEEERAASGRVCGNCLNLGGVHPLLKSFRTCEFSKSRMASPDRAPDCESFSRRTDATIQCRRSETTP